MFLRASGLFIVAVALCIGCAPDVAADGVIPEGEVLADAGAPAELPPFTQPRVTRINDAQYGYDDSGFLISVGDALRLNWSDGLLVGFTQRARPVYCEGGCDPSWEEGTIAYVDGRPSSVHVDGAERWKFAYDTRGNLTEMSLNEGNFWTTVVIDYDALERPVRSVVSSADSTVSTGAATYGDDGCPTTATTNLVEASNARSSVVGSYSSVDGVLTAYHSSASTVQLAVERDDQGRVDRFVAGALVHEIEYGDGVFTSLHLFPSGFSVLMPTHSFFHRLDGRCDPTLRDPAKILSLILNWMRRPTPG